MRTVILLLFSLSINAQNAVWQNFGPAQKFETAGKMCLDDTDHLYYLANGDSTQFTGTDWLLYKLDLQGNIIWRRLYGNTGNYIAAKVVFANDKLYVAGERTWNDTSRAWISVLDTSGNTLQTTFFGSGDTTVVGQDLYFDPIYGFALLNQIRSGNGAEQAVQVLLLDSNLNIKARHLQIDTLSFVGQAIIALPNGEWVYTSDLELPNRFDLLVTKIDQQGNFIKRLVVSSGFTRGGNALDLNSKGQIAIGGEGASAFSLSFDITLTILDNNLNLISDLYVLPGAIKNDACFEMIVSPFDTYIFSGYAISNENGLTQMIVAESDEFGKLLHIDRYSSSSVCIGSGIVCDSSGNFFAAGSDFNSSPSLILARGQAKGLDLKHHEFGNWSLFPNPSINGVFSLKNSDLILDKTNFILVNSQGVLVPFHFENEELQIIGPPGAYFLTERKSGAHFKLIYR
jgi:hypothetical protein